MAITLKKKSITRWLLIVLALVLVLAGIASTHSASQAAAEEKYLVFYQSGAKQPVVDQVLALGGTLRFEFDNIDVLAITLPSDQRDTLAADADVLAVEVDPKHRLLAQTVPYGIDMVQARDTWDADRDGVIDSGAPTGEGIRVCIVDTGIYAAHEDLGGGGVEILAGRSWVNEEWDEDRHGHGTHVAGTVAAQNNTVGVVGVSPGQVELIIADVFNDLGESQDSAVILDAANWCAEQGANIISMSLGGPIGLLADGYQALYDQGILIVAAAGNDFGPVNNYPASYPAVMSIAAVDSTGTRADFSNFVPEVELAAPGVSVLSTWPFADYVAVDGGPRYTANPLAGADPPGTTQGPLADGGTCDTTPPPDAYADQIVLCERGGLPFKAKVENAAAGGAVAAIIYNNEPGNFSGTVVCCSTIPAVSLNQADGQDLVANWLSHNATVKIHNEDVVGYSELSGTSMATPHASGVAAVLWSACPDFNNDQIRSHLDRFTIESEADTLEGRDVFYGYGIPQLKNAVDALFDGVDEYDPGDPNNDGSRPANVECSQQSSIEATGGGWLEGQDGSKINFSFDLEQPSGGSPSGSLKLNDRSQDVKIEMTTISALNEGSSSCDMVSGDQVVEILGQGTFNGQEASFRSCAADSGSPGKGHDQFFLECSSSSCAYSSAASALDPTIDGGNLQVSVGSGGSGASDPSVTTMILDPLLLSEGLVGQLQVFTVAVYDQAQDPMADAAVTLTRTAADGNTETLTALTDLTGTAVFSLLNLDQAATYLATTNTAESNTVELSPVLE